MPQNALGCLGLFSSAAWDAIAFVESYCAIGIDLFLQAPSPGLFARSLHVTTTQTGIHILAPARLGTQVKDLSVNIGVMSLLGSTVCVGHLFDYLG